MLVGAVAFHQETIFIISQSPFTPLGVFRLLDIANWIADIKAPFPLCRAENMLNNIQLPKHSRRLDLLETLVSVFGNNFCRDVVNRQRSETLPLKSLQSYTLILGSSFITGNGSDIPVYQ